MDEKLPAADIYPLRRKAHALFATALAHAVVTVTVLLAGLVPAGEQAGILAFNVWFVALWIASALLFRRAINERQTA